MDPAESQSAVDVFQGDGKILGMGCDVGGDALPANDAILAAEMVVVGGWN